MGTTVALRKSKTVQDGIRAAQMIARCIGVLEQIDIGSLTEDEAQALQKELRRLDYRLEKACGDINRKADETARAQSETMFERNAKAREEWSARRAAERQAALDRVLAIGDAVRAEKDALFKKYERFYKMKVRGHALGEIWSNEFEAYRKNGAFEASLFDQLNKHARSDKPVKVKNMVSGEVLAGMVAKAEKVAGGKYSG